MNKLKTLKDLEIGDNPDWECSNCGMLNSSDNPYCRDCDKENYEREELEKEKMSELKTLEDIFGYDTGKSFLISKEDLKAEAVKWIKYLEKHTCFDSKVSDCKTSAIGLKLFFNLTEERKS